MEPVTTTKLITNDREYMGAVIGTLLGDASLAPIDAGNSRLRFGQANREYALWKREVLSYEHSLSEYQTGNMTIVTSPRLPLFSALRERIYYNGRKTIDSHIMKCLTPLGLALWYYDDGDLHRTAFRVLISSMSFNYAEHLLMQEALFKQFNLHFNILTRKSRTGLKVFYFRLKNSDRKLFFDLIGPYRIECMAYKFPTTEGMDTILNHSRMNPSEVNTKMDNVIELYNSGLSTYVISKLVGLNAGTILGRLRKAGIPIRNAGKYSSRDSLALPEMEGESRNDSPQDQLLS